MKLTQAHLDLYKRINSRGIGRGCNDLEKEEKSLLSESQWQEFCKSYHEWNGNLEDYDSNRPIMMDFMVVGFIQHILITSYQGTL